MRRRCSRLAPKAFQRLRVARQFVRQELQRDEAPAQLFDNAVARHGLTDHIGANGRLVVKSIQT
jgi:hypothetical protein